MATPGRYRLHDIPIGIPPLQMREEYTGPMLRFVWKSIPDLGPSFQQFADGLKAAAEASAAEA